MSEYYRMLDTESGRAEIQRLEEKRDKIVCDFFLETPPEQAANIKNILAKYEYNYRALASIITSLEREIEGHQKVIDNWTTLRKQTHRDQLETKRNILQPFRQDKMILNDFFEKYKKYAYRIPRDRDDLRPYSFDFEFFEVLKTCATPAAAYVPAADDDAAVYVGDATIIEEEERPEDGLLPMAKGVSGGKKSKKSKKSIKGKKSKKSNKSKKSKKSKK